MHPIKIIAALAIGITSSQGAITFLNKATFTDVNTRTDSFSYTTTFDPNNAADALVLMFATESAAPTATVKFGTQDMVYAAGLVGNNPVAIYYLNSPSLTSQTVDVTITRPGGGNINGIGFSIFALNTTDDKDIEVVAFATDAVSALSIDITVPIADSFVVAGFNSSAATGGASVNTPLTSLHNGDWGSLQGALGYQENVGVGTQTYSFTSAAATFSSAVAFNVVPEPSAALLGGFGLLALLRRRRN
jgi:hypothetical protein